MTSSTTTSSDNVTHIAVLPSAGAGHLLPCLRLAATLIRLGGCHRITLLIPHPTVSNAELHIINRFLSSYPPHVATAKDFHLQPLNSNSGGDAFWLHVQAIRRSAHLLAPLLSSLSPPPSAFLSDVALASAFVEVTKSFHIPIYALFVSSALMFSLISAFPTAVDTAIKSSGPDLELDLGDAIEIPGRPPIPTSFLPPVLLDTKSLFATIFLESGRDLKRLSGVFINTFEGLEPEALDALITKGGGGGATNCKTTTTLIPIGPLLPAEFETTGSTSSSTTTTVAMEWLNSQPARSVMYVSFGNRTAAERDQLKELGEGLVLSGFRFLWVVKLKVVDKDESEELSDVLGGELMERAVEKGHSLVVKDWVDQTAILGHVSVGGFLTHAGWNSVLESLWEGVPMLMWPQGGDQRINAAAIEGSAAGVWPKSWGWCGEEKLVGREEIAERVREVMGSESVRVRAERMRKAARESAGIGGGRNKAALMGVIQRWKKDYS